MQFTHCVSITAFYRFYPTGIRKFFCVQTAQKQEVIFYTYTTCTKRPFLTESSYFHGIFRSKQPFPSCDTHRRLSAFFSSLPFFSPSFGKAAGRVSIHRERRRIGSNAGAPKRDPTRKQAPCHTPSRHCISSYIIAKRRVCRRAPSKSVRRRCKRGISVDLEIFPRSNVSKSAVCAGSHTEGQKTQLGHRNRRESQAASALIPQLTPGWRARCVLHACGIGKMTRGRFFVILHIF